MIYHRPELAEYVDVFPPISKNSLPVASFRIATKGEFTARELGSLFLRLNDIYVNIWELRRDLKVFDLDPDTLMVQSVNINSPGIIELIGNLNPLKWIYDFTKLIMDYRVEKGLRQYRAEELEMKNREFYYKLLDKEIDLMKKAGFTKLEIKNKLEAVIGPVAEVYWLSSERSGIYQCEIKEIASGSGNLKIEDK